MMSHEGVGEVQQGEQLPMQAVSIQIRLVKDEEQHSATVVGGASQPAEADPISDEVPQDADCEDMQVCTTSTNTADDYAHRGPSPSDHAVLHLQDVRPASPDAEPCKSC